MLSKNAMKKAAKLERMQAEKGAKRAYQKQQKKDKRQLFIQKRDAGELSQEELALEQQRKKSRALAKRKKPASQLWKGGVVIDLGFDDLMVEKEIVSLTSQLSFLYSANRRAAAPIDKLIFTSFDGRTRERMQNLNDASYSRWQKTTFWADSYQHLWTADQPTVSKDKVVYLTADTEIELEELKEDEFYVIGGIVDHNRYKNLCAEKAIKDGVRVARLPIGKYLEHMRARKVITVNQVFEILLKWIETRDWKLSLEAIMPKRKFDQLDAEEEGGDNEDDDDVD